MHSSYGRYGYDGIHHITLKKGPRVYVANQDKVDEHTIKQFISYLHLRKLSIYSFENTAELKELLQDPEKAYEFVFEGKLEGGPLAQEILEKSFKKDMHHTIKDLLPPEEIVNADAGS
jgi:hypothetical protein